MIVANDRRGATRTPLLLAAALLASCFSDPGGSGGTSDSSSALATGDASPTTTMTSDDSSVSATTRASEVSSSSTGATTTASSVGATDDGSTTGGTDDCAGACVEPPPPGWFGPVAARENDVDAATPGCLGAYPDAVWSLYGGLTAEGECACACSFDLDASGCGPTTAYRYAACGQEPTIELMIGDQECHAWFGGNLGGWKVDPAPVEGDCAPEVTSALDDAAFTTRWTACGGATVSACGDGVCAPTLPDGYDRLCVYQEGEHACPAGDYAVQVTRYTSVDDARACDDADCQCGAPAPSCDTSLHLSSEFCTIGKGVAFQECKLVSQVGSYMLMATPSPNTACPPVQDALPPTGAATALGAVTFCCTA
ncbi:MAG: hypothetical protein H6713_02555 [Myxococcales bacterium]|nr:hypothetical protein [Myxococcales bacterium]